MLTLSCYCYKVLYCHISCIVVRAGHYTVARRIRRINPSHSFPSVIVAIVSHAWSRFPNSVDKKPPIWLIYDDKIIHESRIGHTITIIAVSAVTGIDYTNLM